MKRFTILFSIALTIYLISCSKNNTPENKGNNNNTALPTKAETKPQYDNTNFGVYKGVIIGSTGIILFYINNEDNVVKCYLTIDNQKDTLTTAAKITLGQPIVNALFTGRISSVTLNADANGNNAALSNIKISGHNNVGSYIIHENSTSQVTCFEGKIEGDLQGTLNMIRFGNIPDTVYAIMKLHDNDTTYIGFGGNSYVKDTLYIAFRVPNLSKIIGSVGGKYVQDTVMGHLTKYIAPKNNKEGTFKCIRTY